MTPVVTEETDSETGEVASEPVPSFARNLAGDADVFYILICGNTITTTTITTIKPKTTNNGKQRQATDNKPPPATDGTQHPITKG